MARISKDNDDGFDDNGDDDRDDDDCDDNGDDNDEWDDGRSPYMQLQVWKANDWHWGMKR